MGKQIRLKYLFEKRIGGAWGEDPEEGNSIVCIRVADFITDKLIHKQTDLTRRSFKNDEIEKKQLKAGDLIIEKSGGGENQPVGRVVLFSLNEPALCSNFLEVLRPKTSLIIPKFGAYVLYSLWSNRITTKSIKQTTGIQNLDVSEYLDSKVDLPNINQQTKILEFLDKEIEFLDQLISAKEKLLNVLSEKIEVLITNFVTKGINQHVKLKETELDWLGEIPRHWKITKIKYLTEKIGSGVTPKGGAEVYKQEGIPLLRSQNVHFKGLLLDDVVYIDNETHEAMSNSKVRKGDVLLNITGASLGRCYYYEEQYPDANVNQHVCILRPNKNVLTKYLYYFLRSNLGQNQMNVNQEGGGREGLTFENIKAFILPIPAIEEQREIINEIENEMERISKLLKSTENSIALLRERKISLITEAVTGQLIIKQ